MLSKREENSEPEEASSSSLTSAMSLINTGISSIPPRYILPPSERPNACLKLQPNTFPILDLGTVHHPFLGPQFIQKVNLACREVGFFLVINHGIEHLLKDALESASLFFNLPAHEKMVLSSNDVCKPVRYGTSFNQTRDQIHFWRDFLKHYAHPLSKWINCWPCNPPQYREKMGNYAVAVQALAMELMEAIFESLGLEPNYLKQDMDAGSQVLAVNCYPPCPEPGLALGMPPHSDFGHLTILSQNCEGLEILDKEEAWVPVPHIEGALLVHVGDHLEIMSNGRYKSVIHRAVVNAHKRRLSIASLHSLAIDKKVSPAAELVDVHHPIAYKDTSFADFLHFLSANDIYNERFIETLKINNAISNTS